ncbi:MAG: endo-1,4-beta-xylanase [Bacteroidetes bacterium]|nr:endo-1,4-beta-xylanase [Bacteroidota bacterium]
MSHKYSLITILCLISLLSVSSTNKECTLENPEKEMLEKSIQKNRKGTIILTGKPGSKVKIEQLKHEFWFGCAISSSVFSENSKMAESDIKMYKEKFLENFNSAVTENAVKWGSMERTRGKIDYKTSDNILDWTEENNIPCRGHNLYWGIKKFVQSWLKELDDDELREAIKKRGVETAKYYKGRFVEYDLNNEMIHGNYYEERLGEGITKEMASWVLKGDKNAKLWLNDYDILTGNRLDDFLAHIKKAQKQGVLIAGIGVQGHLHGDTFSREKLQESLDSLAQFGLPIRITEFNVPGQRSKYYKDKSLKMTREEELQKAKDITDYYRICFAHPAVEGILMWGFWAGGNWIKVSSLYNRDWTPTPALEAYQKLIFSDWNSSTSVTLDEKGKAELRAFYGDYKIVSGNKEIFISLEKKKGKKEIKMGK